MAKILAKRINYQESFQKIIDNKSEALLWFSVFERKKQKMQTLNNSKKTALKSSINKFV
jgi:hypothetical protein